MNAKYRRSVIIFKQMRYASKLAWTIHTCVCTRRLWSPTLTCSFLSTMVRNLFSQTTFLFCVVLCVTDKPEKAPSSFCWSLTFLHKKGRRHCTYWWERRNVTGQKKTESPRKSLEAPSVFAQTKRSSFLHFSWEGWSHMLARFTVFFGQRQNFGRKTRRVPRHSTTATDCLETVNTCQTEDVGFGAWRVEPSLVHGLSCGTIHHRGRYPPTPANLLLNRPWTSGICRGSTVPWRCGSNSGQWSERQILIRGGGNKRDQCLILFVLLVCCFDVHWHCWAQLVQCTSPTSSVSKSWKSHFQTFSLANTKSPLGW